MRWLVCLLVLVSGCASEHVTSVTACDVVEARIAELKSEQIQLLPSEDDLVIARLQELVLLRERFGCAV